MEVTLLYGILIIAIGAFTSGSFSMPFEKVCGWKWENHWLVYSFFAYIAMPIAACLILCPGFMRVLTSCPSELLLKIYFLGVLYGVCNLTFGLSLKYLGVSLGFIISLGLMMVLGTIIPPILDGRVTALFGSDGGTMLAVGLIIGVAGVAISAYSGYKKDKTAVYSSKSQLNYSKGMLLALFVGITGASQALGIEQGNALYSKLTESGTDEFFVILPAVAVLFSGSFSITLIWCLAVSLRNKSISLFISTKRGKIISNYLYCALAGLLWFFNMITYGMGKSYMGKYSFTAWGILMSLTIVFATLWGIHHGEWSRVPRRIKHVMYIGLALLVVSSFVIGISNNM